MLELPALTFVLAALCCLRNVKEHYTLSRGLWFALLAGAAVWTKQQAVFLGAVPFLYFVLSRRWRLLLGKTIWVSSGVLALFVVGLFSLSLPVQGTVQRQLPPPAEFGLMLANGLRYYGAALQQEFGRVAGPAIVVGFLALLLVRLRNRRAGEDDALYLAWALAAAALHLLIGHVSIRYLFLVLPPLIVIGYATLFRLCRAILPPRWAACTVGGAAVLYFGLHLDTPVTFLRGPSEAARAVVDPASPRRILYCGETDGSFIFAVRSLDPSLKTIVIRGDKLDPSTFEADKFEEFAHHYGIHYVIIERTETITPAMRDGFVRRHWERLRNSPASSMVLEREIALASSQRAWKGDLRIYRFTNPAPNPASAMRMPLWMINSQLDARF
jgi:hypothetical protein